MPRKRFPSLLVGGIWTVNALILLGMGGAYVMRVNAGPAAGPRPAPPLSEADFAASAPALAATPSPSAPTLTPAATPAASAALVPSPAGSPSVPPSSLRDECPPTGDNPLETDDCTLAFDPLLPTPTPANISVIGYSVAGRELQVHRFGTGPTGRLIIAGIHGGNEGNTVLLAHELIAYVTAHPEMIPKHITLYIMPDLNPDGFARVRGLDGRVNDHGVDLNRNWPWNWQKDWPRGGCWNYRPVTGGVLPLSEPETLALYRFIVEHPDIDALISYHAAALGIFAGGVPDYKPSISLANTVDSVSTYDYPPIDTHCTMTGDLTDWAATWYIAAVDIELHNFRYTDFEDNLAILKAFLKWRR